MTSLKAFLLDWPALSADYAQYHRSKGNQICHYIGIPLIMIALIRWTFWPETSYTLLAVLLPIYFAWATWLGVAMAGFVAFLSVAASFLTAEGALVFFVAGWIFQILGHRLFEKNTPAFTKNLTHILVGPAWILKKALSRD